MSEPKAGPAVHSGGEAQDRLLNELFPVMYPVLRRRAAQCFKGEAPGHTLQATALVHEVYVKLANSRHTYHDQRHLYSVVARVMKQILVDHARGKGARKRGGSVLKVPLDNACHLADQHGVFFLDVNEALDRFREQDPARAVIFELHFFVGLTNREIATALEIDEAKVRYGLSVARARLRQVLGER